MFPRSSYPRTWQPSGKEPVTAATSSVPGRNQVSAGSYVLAVDLGGVRLDRLLDGLVPRAHQTDRYSPGEDKAQDPAGLVVEPVAQQVDHQDQPHDYRAHNPQAHACLHRFAIP